MVSAESYIFPLLRSELCAINLQRTHSVYIDSVIKLQLERIGAILLKSTLIIYVACQKYVFIFYKMFCYTSFNIS